MRWKWQYADGYATRTDNAGRRTIRMHRVILERMGHKNFACSDHIDRDMLNNLRSNLRLATARQNGCNCDKRQDNTSGYIGVSWYKRDKKWQVKIRVNGKLKHLRYFDDVKDAARVYDKAALKYHGEFAVLNGV